MKKKCVQCEKDQPDWAFKSGDVCMFCNPESVEIKAKESHNYEEVEDVGCAGGACTL
ncbi:hypothetical protein J7620_09985 [Wohlfahrtiimonas chitiniclastica]|uniref:hypothetical protein n=1 Tax=Wohlfahrtiimonas chitiniclastica TaxID=400946 RepID=UPI001BCB079A|nr:hypothetical protein [Wohlfahrtiimonas chitiniclastica]MBS7835270.1 hypothetical protein [Wohlfahrtiimonas chitiniclastica]